MIKKLTVFERMWEGDEPCLPVYQGLGTMAIVANPQKTVGHLIVFPRRPVEKWHHLTYPERARLSLVSNALARLLDDVFGPLRVIQQVQGFGVPDHAHLTVFPAYTEADKDKLLLHPPRVKLQTLEPVQRLLRLPESYILEQLEEARAELVHAEAYAPLMN